MAILYQTKGATITVIDAVSLVAVFANLQVKDATLSGLTTGEFDATHCGSGDFIEFYKRYLIGENRRKISSQVCVNFRINSLILSLN